MQPAQVHAVTFKFLIDNFLYSEKQAEAFAQMLINATVQSNDPTTYFIIHRGIDGYHQYKTNEQDALMGNYTDMMKKIND